MVTLDNLENCVMPMERFPLKWRFTESKYNVLPPVHLSQVRPLEPEAARFLWDVTLSSGLHEGTPFGSDFFERVESFMIPQYEDERAVKKWLYQRGLSFSHKVYLSWQPELAVTTTWKILIKYWSDFYCPGSDDLSVFDKSLTWALVIYHYDYIGFGTNRKCRQETSEGKLVETETF